MQPASVLLYAIDYYGCFVSSWGIFLESFGMLHHDISAGTKKDAVLSAFTLFLADPVESAMRAQLQFCRFL